MSEIHGKLIIGHTLIIYGQQLLIFSLDDHN